MLAPERDLFYTKVYSDVTKRWLLAWNQSKQIAYYILYILIANSVFIFFTIAQL